MWILTTIGAFSIVLAETQPGSGQPDPDRLMIRARRREHLELLQREHAALAPLPIIESHAGLDYRWRIVAPKALVRTVVEEAVARIDYRNFKSAAQRRHAETNAEYVASLHAIWNELRRLQSNP